MIVYLAGSSNEQMIRYKDSPRKPYILESYYYYGKDMLDRIACADKVILDSGAFTFMQNTKKVVDWEAYTIKYGEFVKEFAIENFFELDIDQIIGYEEVKRLRNVLEKTAGKQCIPVWHTNRGKEEFISSCKEYPYVALGGIVGKQWKEKAFKYMPWFINTAHENNAKIHGLGFTRFAYLKDFHFDSVDSATWSTGGARFGYIHYFTGKNIRKVAKPEGMRLAKYEEVNTHNFDEWIKFQKYAEMHL